MNYIFVAIIAFLVVLTALKWNNMRTKLAFYLISLGVIFVLIISFIAVSDEGISAQSIEGVTSAVKTYASWIGTAASNIVKISTYAFKQGWKNNSTEGGS